MIVISEQQACELVSVEDAIAVVESTFAAMALAAPVRMPVR